MTAQATNITAAPTLVRRLRFRVPLLVAFGLGWLGLMVFTAVFADVIRPYDVTQMDLSARLVGPLSPGHLLGTDELGW